MQKYLFIGFFICIANLFADWDKDSRQRELKQVSIWRDYIQKSEEYEPTEKIKYLEVALRNSGYRRSINNHLHEIDEIYLEIQKILLATPGHAKYFAESLEKQRGALKEGQFRGSYNDAKYRIIVETLVHLPSPETVEVLGKYLSDERDNTYDAQFISEDVIPPVNTSLLAAHTLANIGIRNAPAKSKYPFPTKDDGKELEIYREWFQKVIAGEITVSFMGQAVEYRFKPDGTWDTIAIANPPDDGIQLLAKANLKESSEQDSKEPNKESWPWLVIVAVAGGAVLVSLLLWKKKVRA